MITILIVSLTACSVIALIWNHHDAKMSAQENSTMEYNHTEKKAA